MASITTIQSSDIIKNSRADINNNFTNLNNDKIETGYLDTDTTLASNSDSKIATQKAVKAYVDSGGNQNASETQKGIVEEATDAEVTAGTATGATGATLFITPAKLATRLLTTDSRIIIPLVAGETIDGSTTPKPIFFGRGKYDYVSKAGASSYALYAGGGFKGVAYKLTSVPITTIDRVSVKLARFGAGNPDGTLTISLVADNAGSPGTNIVTVASITKDDITGSLTEYTYTISPTTTQSTMWITFVRSTNGDVTNTFDVGGDSTGTDTTYRTADGSTWVSQDTSSTGYVKLSLSSSAGSVYVSDANDSGRSYFDGFVTQNLSSGQSANVLWRGLLSGFTGLTGGNLYYVTDTIGTISTSAGSTSLPVGRAVSTTQIVVTP